MVVKKSLHFKGLLLSMSSNKRTREEEQGGEEQDAQLKDALHAKKQMGLFITSMGGLYDETVKAIVNELEACKTLKDFKKARDKVTTIITNANVKIMMKTIAVMK